MKTNSVQKTLRIAPFVVLALALGMFLAAQIYQRVAAQASTPTDDDVNRIAHQLYCPVCENTPLDVCPTEACRQWRALIKQKLASGETEAQIKQYFIDQYGMRVVGEPPLIGINWLVYVLPPAVILIGAFFLLRAFRLWTKPSLAAPVSGSGNEAQDDYVARLEEELKKRN